MRVLATCQPAAGHFQPMVPIGRALAQAGHEVVVATTAPFCPVVEAAGFGAVAVGLDWQESEVDRAFPDLVANGTRLDDIRRGWRLVFARAAQGLIPDLMRAIDELAPDLVLSESLDLSGPVVAEASGLPHAVLGVGAQRPLPLLAASIGPYWTAARAALGLPPDPGLNRFCPYLYLDPCPASLQPYPRRQLLASTRPVGPEPNRSPVAPAAGTGAPTVYVSMGTVFNRVANVFDVVIEALVDEPVDVVVTVGANRDPASIGPAGSVAGNIRVHRFVDQATLLPGIDAVVCHGGFNTTVAALAHGAPVVALPLAADHHYNAFRVASCGAGLQLDPGQATAPDVRDAVHRALEDPVMRANAGRLADEIASMPPPASAVPLLEAVAGADLASTSAP